MCDRPRWLQSQSKPVSRWVTNVHAGSTVTDERESGLDFSDLRDDLEDESYPLSNDELLDRYGDREIGTENGEKTLRQILGPVESDTYEDADQVRQAVFTMVGESAEGRTEYSDRGTSGDQSDQVSF